MSGLLPGDYCPQRIEELFVSGTEPRAQDNFYQPVIVDRRTGELATARTAAADRLEQVVLVLPDEARRWALEQGIPQPPLLGQALDVDDRDVLRISAPDPYTVYQLSPLLPAEAQRLRLAALAPAATRSVAFFAERPGCRRCRGCALADLVDPGDRAVHAGCVGNAAGRDAPAEPPHTVFGG